MTTPEVSAFITIISVAFAIFAGVMTIRRNARLDDQRYSSDITTVIVKLEAIAEDIKEIKEQVHGLDNKVQSLDRRVTILEQSVNKAHSRLDTMEESV